MDAYHVVLSALNIHVLTELPRPTIDDPLESLNNRKKQTNCNNNTEINFKKVHVTQASYRWKLCGAKKIFFELILWRML